MQEGNNIKYIKGYDINLSSVLGKGSFGVVYEAKTSQGMGEVVAVKMINKSEHLGIQQQKRKKMFLNEIHILQEVTGQHILQAIQVMQSEKYIYIVTQKCASDLRKLMKERGPIRQKEAIEYLTQIVDGMVDLVKNGVIHRDLKPENILIDFKGVLKICDFGVSKRQTTLNMQNNTYTGTPAYHSLEMATSQRYTSKCDVWALGIIFYELLHGKHPWLQSDDSIYSLVNKIKEVKPQIDPKLSKLSQDFLTKTLERAEKDRLSWEQVFAHPIFNNKFKQYLIESEKKENKLKVLMKKLRFQVSSKDIDVKQHMKTIISFPNIQNIELNFKDFVLVIKSLQEDVTEEEIRFFFDRIDLDKNGTISMKQIEQVMNEENIHIGQSKVRQITSKNQIEATEETIKKAKAFFQHLHKILQHKKTSLDKTFNAYDKEKKKKLTFQTFKNMISRVSKSITLSEEEIHAFFELIDKDHSSSIEYEQLYGFYCEANEINPAAQK